ncbi:MAG: ComEC/Rec2 family competence protein, partial [Candidatus Omnitrophica bacterium]|nr:ComEC/Rec2 family competence protein [Candidatus Omnitrophota bacterium]
MSVCVALWRGCRNGVTGSELRVAGEAVDARNPQPATRNAQLVALLLFWGCLGTLRMTVWHRHPDAQLTEALSDEPQPVRLHGLVVDDPVELFEPGEVEPDVSSQVTGSGLRVPGELSATRNPKLATRNGRQICVLALRHRETAAGWRPIAGRLRATIHSPRQFLRYGDEILVEGQWFRVPAPSNPGQYDWRASLARKRIHGLLRVRPFDGLVMLGRGQGNRVLAAVFRLRQRWEQLLRVHFNARDAGLLLGLLLGQRAEIDEDLKEAFQTTGTIHLLVISGFNVGLIAALLELFFRLAGVPWRLRLILLALSLGAYAILTGLQPPVVRATLMAWLVLGARALDRALSWFNILAAAALVMVWIDPAQLFDPGFQLSFGAVLSLLVFTGRWKSWLDGRLGWVRPGWLRRYLCLSLTATSAVWVGLAPILGWYFHLVSPVSMLANLVIAPLMSALVSVGTTLLMAATLYERIMAWGHGPLTLLLAATVRAVSWCHAIPGGFWFIGHPAPLFLLGYYGLLSLSILRVRLGWTHGYALSVWLAGLAIWVWGLLARHWVESRWLRV